MDEPTNDVNKKSNFLREPQKYGVRMSGSKGNRFGDLQDLATLNNVATIKLVQKERVKGWMGKPKGLLQKLWERGFIDTNFGTRSYYTLVSRNNQCKNMMLDTSFPNLMRK